MCEHRVDRHRYRPQLGFDHHQCIHRIPGAAESSSLFVSPFCVCSAWRFRDVFGHQKITKCWMTLTVPRLYHIKMVHRATNSSGVFFWGGCLVDRRFMYFAYFPTLLTPNIGTWIMGFAETKHHKFQTIPCCIHVHFSFLGLFSCL